MTHAALAVPQDLSCSSLGREQVLAQLRRELGDSAELVSWRSDGAQRVRGLAVSAGRVMSFVLHAQEQRLRTRPLLALLRHSRRG